MAHKDTIKDDVLQETKLIQVNQLNQFLRQEVLVQVSHLNHLLKHRYFSCYSQMYVICRCICIDILIYRLLKMVEEKAQEEQQEEEQVTEVFQLNHMGMLQTQR